jgi:hypothetical protein
MHKSELEVLINPHLSKVFTWLSANKLSLNIDKINFVVFHSPQKKINYYPKLYLNQIAISIGNHAMLLVQLGINSTSDVWKFCQNWRVFVREGKIRGAERNLPVGKGHTGKDHTRWQWSHPLARVTPFVSLPTTH